MGYFSKELQILDRNTVKYMIDQLQEENDKLQDENINLRQKYSNDVKQLVTTIEKYKTLYGELPDK